jgi:dephospho-CoA kinase
VKTLIGLTGGIGSGKTTVGGMFQVLGIPVYSSDVRAKWLMQNDPSLKASIIALLGQESYDEAGALNRAWIASRVFQNADLLKALNALVHPAVHDDLLQWAALPEHQEAPYVIQESALLFEENLTQRMSAIILVVAPEDIRIHRVMERDQVSKEDVIRRMKHQWPDQKKIPGSDYIIFNDGARSLISQVKDIDLMIRGKQ